MLHYEDVGIHAFCGNIILDTSSLMWMATPLPNHLKTEDAQDHQVTLADMLFALAHCEQNQAFFKIIIPEFVALEFVNHLRDGDSMSIWRTDLGTKYDAPTKPL